MPSFQMHLAVAKVYMENHNIENEKEFISGILDPDLAENKDKSHYTDPIKDFTLKEILKTKVNLKKYLEENRIDNDYQRGVFLHLLTDYDFFNHYINYNDYQNISCKAFFDNLYYSYDKINEFLLKEYPVDTFSYKEILERKIIEKQNSLNLVNVENILEIKKVDKWINDLGKQNLEEIIDKILD